MEKMKELVRTFYTECLTVNDKVNPTERMEILLADDFKSINTSEIKEKKIMIGQIWYFWKLIPNLKWEPQEILQDGNKIIVRSNFSGSPVGEFMGMKLDGTKSFNSMSIDIHTVEHGKISKIYHVEEWTTVIAQLKK